MKRRNVSTGTLACVLSLVVLMGCGDSPTEAEAYVDANWNSADIVKGGKLYDKWWKVNGGTEPTTDFNPVWASQTTNTRSGADTWRCKECHGWDYVGNLGRYSSGSHFTGFAGVFSGTTGAGCGTSTSISVYDGVRLERMGSVFYMYHSSDGVKWSEYEMAGGVAVKIDTAGSSPPGSDNATAFDEVCD